MFLEIDPNEISVKQKYTIILCLAHSSVFVTGWPLVVDDPQGSMLGVTKLEGGGSEEKSNDAGCCAGTSAGVAQGSLFTFLLLSTVAYNGGCSFELAVLSPHGSEKLPVHNENL